MGIQDPNRFANGVGEGDPQARLSQKSPQRFAAVRVIVDHENARAL
jgi:hypothetical protein